MSRIKTYSSPTLTVASATAFTQPSNTLDEDWDSSNSRLRTTKISGEIIKIVANFSSSASSSAVLTIASRDTPTETVCEITDWSSDVTRYTKVLATDYVGAALTTTTNTYAPFVVNGSLTISCSGATATDTVSVKIYWR